MGVQLKSLDEFESKKRSVGDNSQCYNVTIPGSIELKGEKYAYDSERRQASSHNGKRPPLGICCGPRFAGRWRVLLFGQDNWRVLPPFVPGASGETRACEVSCDLRGCRKGWISPLQTVQAESASTRGTACRDRRGSLSTHRGFGGSARSRSLGRPCGDESLSLPPRLQSHHRADTTRLRGSEAYAEGAKCAGHQ